MIFKLLAFLDLLAVSLVVPALGTHFLNNEIVWIGSVYGIGSDFQFKIYTQFLYNAYSRVVQDPLSCGNFLLKVVISSIFLTTILWKTFGSLWDKKYNITFVVHLSI